MEQKAIVNNNIVDATMWIFLFEYMEGELTEQEKNRMKERLMKITAEKKVL
ncbi:MAG: hypothetical protein ACXWE6_13595 [Nitrososphaeraceae archaeon]